MLGHCPLPSNATFISGFPLPAFDNHLPSFAHYWQESLVFLIGVQHLLSLTNIHFFFTKTQNNRERPSTFEETILSIGSSFNQV